MGTDETQILVSHEIHETHEKVLEWQTRTQSRVRCNWLWLRYNIHCMGWFAFTKKFLNRLCGWEEYPGLNFTPRAQQVFGLARNEAERLHHNFIGTEHVLLGLIKLGAGVSANVLVSKGVTLEKVRGEVERNAPAGPVDQFVSSLPYTPRVKKVLAWAREEARALRHSYVGTDHLLLGLLRERDGMAARVLRNCGADLEQIRIEVFKGLDPNYNSDDEFYTRYFADLKERAKQKAANRQSPQDEKLEFTPRAQQVLALARKESDRLNHNYLGTEHILAGLIELGNGIPANVLAKKGMTLEQVRAELDLVRGPTQKMFGNIPFTPRVKRVIHHAREEARALNHTYIGTEHLLLGLLTEDRGPAVDLFKKFGVDMNALHQEILDELKPPHA